MLKQHPIYNCIHSSSYRAVGEKWKHSNISFWSKRPSKEIGWGA